MAIAVISLPIYLAADERVRVVRRRLVGWGILPAVVVALVGLGRGLAALPELPAENPPAIELTAGATAAEPALPLVGGAVYVVQPGDSMWAIARRLAPSGTAELVDRMVAENRGASLSIGQQIVLPVP